MYIFLLIFKTGANTKQKLVHFHPHKFSMWFITGCRGTIGVTGATDSSCVGLQHNLFQRTTSCQKTWNNIRGFSLRPKMIARMLMRNHLRVVMAKSDSEDAPTVCVIMWPPFDFHNTSITIEGIISSFLCKTNEG